MTLIGPVTVTVEFAVNPNDCVVMNSGKGRAQQPALRTKGFDGFPILAVSLDRVVSPVTVIDSPCGTDLEADAATIAC